MRKKNIIKWWVAAQLFVLLSGCGTVDVQIPEDGITVELGEELSEDISDYVEAEDYTELSIDTDSVDLSAVGTYTATVYYKTRDIGTLQIAVVDTTAPETKLMEDVRIEKGQALVVDDYVDELIDPSETETWFMLDSLQLQGETEAEPNLSEANLSKRIEAQDNGSYQINVLVRDEYKNYAIYPFLFEVYTPDTEAPVITADDIVVEYGNTPDYMDDVSADDDVDGDLTDQLNVDTSQVNVNKAGQYTVIYSVSDAAGNQGTKEITVTVREKKTEASKQTAEQPSGQSSGSASVSQSPGIPAENAVTVESESSSGSNNENDAVTVQPEHQPIAPVEPEEPVIPETPPATITAEFDDGKAAELLSLVNEQRQSRGLGTVTEKDSLREKARERAKAGNGNGSGVIMCRGTGASSASSVIDAWNADWPEGTWMTEAWKYAGAACYNDSGTYTWVVVFGAY